VPAAYRRAHDRPLLEFGREREGIDLSKGRLTHLTLKSKGKQRTLLGDGDNPKLEPLSDTCGGQVNDPQKALLA